MAKINGYSWDHCKIINNYLCDSMNELCCPSYNNVEIMVVLCPCGYKIWDMMGHDFHVLT